MFSLSLRILGGGGLHRLHLFFSNFFFISITIYNNNNNNNNNIRIYIHTYIHTCITHTHTHTVCVCVCVCIGFAGKFLAETGPLKGTTGTNMLKIGFTDDGNFQQIGYYCSTNAERIRDLCYFERYQLSEVRILKSTLYSDFRLSTSERALTFENVSVSARLRVCTSACLPGTGHVPIHLLSLVRVLTLSPGRHHRHASRNCGQHLSRQLPGCLMLVGGGGISSRRRWTRGNRLNSVSPTSRLLHALVVKRKGEIIRGGRFVEGGGGLEVARGLHARGCSFRRMQCASKLINSLNLK
jgi:hypothetical protein